MHVAATIAQTMKVDQTAMSGNTDQTKWRLGVILGSTLEYML